MKNRLLIILLMTITAPAFSQTPHAILRYFSADVVKGQVRLSWSISGGNTCSGIVIQRSVDEGSFENIGKIDGVCGSPDVDVPYVFLDAEPVSTKINTYRLELGTQGYSDVRSVEFVLLNDDGFLLRYDMQTRSAEVFLDNALNDRVDYTLYTVAGAKVLDDFTNSNKITLNLRPYAGQIFLLRITHRGREIPVKVPGF